VTGRVSEAIPGASYAFQVIHPGPSIMRVRYRRGVGIDPYGFPDWVPYALMQDLTYANGCFGDRLSSNFLAIGYVQGGLIAVRVRGSDAGSIWYWDDDDPHARDHHQAEQICSALLHRVADNFGAFWLALRESPATLRALAASGAADGQAAIVTEVGQGAGLPTTRRAS
jgi:hypothetical protein